MTVGLLLKLGSLQLGCLPLDDLSSYSSEWERQTREVASNLRPDASASADGLGDGGATDGAGAVLDASAPLDASPPGDAGPDSDAGESPLDAGAPGPALDAAAAEGDAAVAP